MSKAHAALTLATLLGTAAALAQTTTTAKKPVTHRSTTSSTRARPAAAASPVAASPAVANPADTPPNVPPVAGTPRPLYALRYVDTVVGTGDLSVPRKWYSVRYTGWLTDGTKFDSSDDHEGKAPLPFPYGGHQVIPGWDTGFEGMRIGGKRRLYIPYQLAYGEAGRPPVIPAKADLIFDIELVAMSDTRPPDPSAPPAPPSRPETPPADPATTPPTDPTKPTSTSPSPSSNPPSSHPTAPPSNQTPPK